MASSRRRSPRRRNDKIVLAQTPSRETKKKKLTYDDEIQAVGVNTPSKTAKLSKEEIMESQGAHKKNTSFLKTFIELHHELIATANDHDFFKAMKVNRSLFVGLNQDSFVPANKDYPEDSTFKENMKQITKASKDFVSKGKGKILVFKSSKLKGITSEEIGMEEIATLHNKEDNCWLSTKVFDAYLQNLVVPDVTQKHRVHNIIYVS